MALNMAIKLEDQLLLPMLILVMDILPITFLVSKATSLSLVPTPYSIYPRPVTTQASPI